MMVMLLRLVILLFYLSKHSNKIMRVLIIIFLFFSSALFSQITINEDFNVEKFPDVSFSLNIKSNTILTKKSIKLIQNINNIDEQIDSISILQKNDTTDFSRDNKCVLILIEALNNIERYEQSYTFFKSLRNSLSDIVLPGDQIKLYAFSLRGSNTKILKEINLDFTDNIDMLSSSLDDYQIKENPFTRSNVSDIYGALLESIKVLNDFDSNLPKSIFLMSEERNNKFATQKSSLNVVNQAKKSNIIINTVKYNRSLYHQYADPTIADQTCGSSYVLSRSSGNLKKVNSKKLVESNEILLSCFSDLVKSSKGNDYIVSFTSKFDLKDGNIHKTIIKIDKLGFQDTLSIRHSGNWLYKQFQLNFYLTLIILILLFLILIYLSFYINKYLKNIKIKKAENLEKQRVYNLDQEEKIKKQDLKFNELKNKEDDRIRLAEKENRQKLNEDEIQNQIKSMLSIGKFPILKFSHLDVQNQFEINHPKISVGRDKSCSICISNPNISKHHFTIEFKENNYNIFDNNSTNGIILNGIKVATSVLKQGDIIEIADVKFTFYK